LERISKKQKKNDIHKGTETEAGEKRSKRSKAPSMFTNNTEKKTIYPLLSLKK